MKAKFVVMAAVVMLAVVLALGGTAWADQSAAPVDPMYVGCSESTDFGSASRSS